MLSAMQSGMEIVGWGLFGWLVGGKFVVASFQNMVIPGAALK
jgi:hypothetical protein